MIELFFKGGPLMYPILLCSVVGVAVIAYKFFQFRAILGDIEQPITALAKQKPKVLQPVFEAVESGGGDRELSIAGTRLTREIEKGLSWLSLITTIAPLLGLSGTVLGMIKAFLVIEETQSVHPSVLAGGIWVALITTVAGLFVAIVVHIGHHYLEKEADEIAFVVKEIITGIAGNGSTGN